jgi:enterochelin esterase family protein
MGASLGGLMALYCGLRAPGIFGRVLSQSGAFIVEGHPFVVWDLIRYEPRLPIQLWMDVGRFEWLLDANRKLHALIRDKAAAVDYHEYNGGHNYAAWRDDLPRGLAALFAGGARAAP